MRNQGSSYHLSQYIASTSLDGEHCFLFDNAQNKDKPFDVLNDNDSINMFY